MIPLEREEMGEEGKREKWNLMEAALSDFSDDDDDADDGESAAAQRD